MQLHSYEIIDLGQIHPSNSPRYRSDYMTGVGMSAQEALGDAVDKLIALWGRQEVLDDLWENEQRNYSHEENISEADYDAGVRHVIVLCYNAKED